MFVLFATLATANFSAAETLSGRAIVTDGDTIIVRGSKVRMEGIDAPETGQICLDVSGEPHHCGLLAKAALSRLIGGRSVRCETTGLDDYARRLALCVAGADNLNQGMVDLGWALAFTRYSTAYVAAEARARSTLVGLWSGAFIAPWDWRSRNPSTTVLGAFSVPTDAQRRLVGPATAAAAPIAGCSIKGNISRTGARIYHVAGMRDYGRTSINRRSGERWFCTEAEAAAAGWKRAIR
jgi:endonuclease YncB( thermonuclease family)